ncbi:MAG: MupA/Atu3671 family FMN-dependent luciferase-like monooxygenase [Acidobacteriota bacterium]
MDFGVMFFSSSTQPANGNRYRLVVEAAKFADEHGFCCVWTPERHFHEFGGLFPNPAITSAALSLITRRVQLRAGSLISPLHNSIRIAEEWSVVDNLSEGRVAISFGSGWNINDFVFFPERYEERHAIMYEQIELIKKLWSGQHIVQANSLGDEIEVYLFPSPLQEELPIWITSSGNAETFSSAGAIGANVLTHLIGQNIETLAGKIQRYREARESHGFDPEQGVVSLMLHTFLGQETAGVKAKVRSPFREYLRSAISLEERAAMSGGVISGGHRIAPHEIPSETMEELLDLTFDRYFLTAALMGTPADVQPLIWQLEEIGVNEIACLIDFLDDQDAIMESLNYLDRLRASFSADALRQNTRTALEVFVDDIEE